MLRDAGKVLAALLSILMMSAEAGEVVLPATGGQISAPVVSMKEQRWQRVVPQQYDFSCGAAALATLLTYHYGRPTPEAVAFTEMYETGDPADIQARGFSMLDLHRYLTNLGYRADGFRLDLAKLEEIGVPAITIIDLEGYTHYVVVKGIAGDAVLVGDPALGSHVMSRDRFESVWSGAVLVVRDEVAEAREQFNLAADWRVRPRAPVHEGVGRDGLSSLSLHRPARGEY